MLRIGNHLPSSKGYLAMGKHAVKLGATTFAFFTRNPRGGTAKPIDEADIQAFLAYAREHDIDHLVAHAPYTMNLCSAKPDIREFGLGMLQDDMKRMEYTPNQYYNFHPGSHTGQGVEAGIVQIADALNQTLTPEQHTTVLLETMAGKGSEIGRSFEELREILDRVTLSEKMGVCLDTCHIWDAGYDIVSDLDGILTQFDQVIGLNRLRAVHLNDSMNPCGAHKDRHQKLGQGCIGLEALIRVVNHPALKNLAAALLFLAGGGTGGFFLGKAQTLKQQQQIIDVQDCTTIYGEITQISGDAITVEGLPVNDINGRGAFFFTVSHDTPITWRSTAVAASALQQGNTIAVTYTGEVLESNPAQLCHVVKLEVLDDTIG